MKSMSELERILQAYQAASAAGRTTALASVVSVSGSTYRRIGAHMLVTEDGEVTGAVSGGCLERDICRHATWVMQSGQAKRLIYDSTDDEDAQDGFALGCNGVVEVLVERLLPDDACMAFLAGCLGRGETAVMATVFAGGTETINKPASRLLWCAAAAPLVLGVDEVGLAQALAEEARGVLASGESAARTFDSKVGRVAVCFEIIKPPPRLVIFGGGHDAVPLATFARALGTRVIVVDPRPGQATRTRFPNADGLIVAEPQDAADRLALDGNSMAVVMNHNYRHDLAALRALLPSPVAYLGMLGPKRRTQRLLADLAASGSIATETQLERLYGPVGLDLGAETPEEVALAIVAEMKAVLARRNGSPSRQRQGALHERVSPATLNWPSVSTDRMAPACAR
jgi:xanthine/CO dehydrogenase XdhC/CoxF family maturation factor